MTSAINKNREILELGRSYNIDAILVFFARDDDVCIATSYDQQWLQLGWVYVSNTFAITFAPVGHENPCEKIDKI